MTKVGMAHTAAANICARFSGKVRGIMALRLTMLSICAAAAVLVYEVALGDLTYLLWELPWSLTPAIVIEAGLWLLVYLSYLARYNSLSRLCAMGRSRKHRLMPFFIALVQPVLFILPLRLLLINLLGKGNAMVLPAILDQISGWWSNMTTRVVLLATVACVLLLLALVYLAVHVALTRMIINRHVLGHIHPLRALRQGFRYCLAPVTNTLRHAFWLLCSAVLMAEFAYLTWMQYEMSPVYIGLGVLLLAGYWLAGFGPGFWGQYHVTFLSLIRHLTDDDYDRISG